ERVPARPDILVPIHPCDTLAMAALHLEDVRDGMSGPDVVGIELDRTPARRLGGGVVAGLLQAEGAAAEHIAIARHTLIPAGQDPGDGVPHRHVLAQEEM